MCSSVFWRTILANSPLAPSYAVSSKIKDRGDCPTEREGWREREGRREREMEREGDGEREGWRERERERGMGREKESRVI